MVFFPRLLWDLGPELRMISFHGYPFCFQFAMGSRLFFQKQLDTHSDWSHWGNIEKHVGVGWVTQSVEVFPKIMTDLWFWWKRNPLDEQFRVFGKCLRKWHRNTSNISFELAKKKKTFSAFAKKVHPYFFLVKVSLEDLWIGSAIGKTYIRIVFFRKHNSTTEFWVNSDDSEADFCPKKSPKIRKLLKRRKIVWRAKVHEPFQRQRERYWNEEMQEETQYSLTCFRVIVFHK